MVKVALVAALAACLVAAASALPQCGSKTVNVNGNKLIFAVVGDWGRVGAIDSMFSANAVNSCSSKGQCCSSLQNPTFPDDFDYTDALDGPQQKLAASLLNDVCGTQGCQFILGMGDNFYPCGADALSSGLNRFKTDWQAVYQSAATPNIKDLSWYHVFGNHDYAFETSPPLQMQYAQNDSKWVQPSDYYARTFTANDVSMTISFLDETPFVGTYAHPVPSTKYFTPYLAGKMTPSYINSDAAAYLNSTSGVCNLPPADAPLLTQISDNATGQIPWLKSCLMEGQKSTWNVVSGHFALYGSDVQWATNQSSKSAYPGQCGGFGSLGNLIKQYGVNAYFNGHDHTQTHADPSLSGVMIGNAPTYGNITYLVSGPNPPTQYFTLGNGGSIQYADGVTPAQPKKYNNFSSVIYNANVQYTANQITDDASYNAGVGEGFAIVIADACTMEVQFYNILDYQVGDNALPVHTAVIDKCGKAMKPADAADNNDSSKKSKAVEKNDKKAVSG